MAAAPVPARVLVVDDEPSITDAVATALRYQGFEVQEAATGRAALAAAASFRPDFIVLDVMLPDVDGFEVARRLRSSGIGTPVLFLTAKDATEDKLSGLEKTHEVFRGEAKIHLTATEFKLLRYLMLNPRQVLSKTQILDHVWEYDFNGDDNVVETFVSYLRRKLDRHGLPLIHTIRLVGYSLRLPANDSE